LLNRIAHGSTQLPLPVSLYTVAGAPHYGRLAGQHFHDEVRRKPSCVFAHESASTGRGRDASAIGLPTG
jgi:hypothetical protein